MEFHNEPSACFLVAQGQQQRERHVESLRKSEVALRAMREEATSLRDEKTELSEAKEQLCAQVRALRSELRKEAAAKASLRAELKQKQEQPLPVPKEGAMELDLRQRLSGPKIAAPEIALGGGPVLNLQNGTRPLSPPPPEEPSSEEPGQPSLNAAGRAQSAKKRGGYQSKAKVDLMIARRTLQQLRETAKQTQGGPRQQVNISHTPQQQLAMQAHTTHNVHHQLQQQQQQQRHQLKQQQCFERFHNTSRVVPPPPPRALAATRQR